MASRTQGSSAITATTGYLVDTIGEVGWEHPPLVGCRSSSSRGAVSVKLDFRRQALYLGCGTTVLLSCAKMLLVRASLSRGYRARKSCGTSTSSSLARFRPQRG